jgi:hypothetical protein
MNRKDRNELRKSIVHGIESALHKLLLEGDSLDTWCDEIEGREWSGKEVYEDCKTAHDAMCRAANGIWK